MGGQSKLCRVDMLSLSAQEHKVLSTQTKSDIDTLAQETFLDIFKGIRGSNTSVRLTDKMMDVQGISKF